MVLNITDEERENLIHAIKGSCLNHKTVLWNLLEKLQQG